MKPISRFAPALVLSAIALVVPQSLLYAQAAPVTDKPIAIVSVGAVDATAADLAKLLTAVGAENEAAMVQTAPKTMVKGVDWSRPWGVIAYLRGEEAKPLIIAPITSLDELQTSPAFQNAPVPESEKIEGGVIKFTGPQTTYAKQQNGWCYFAQEAEALASLPDDPVPLLGGLEKKYDFAVRVYLQRMPPSVREQILSQFNNDAEEAPEAEDDPFGGPAEGADGPDLFGASQFGSAFLEGMFANLDEFTYGMTIDGEAEKATIDFTFTVVENSPAAARLSALEGLKSDHAGLLLPGSLFALHSVIPLLPEDAEAIAGGLEALGETWQPAADPTAEDDAAERERVAREKELTELGKRLMLTTIRSGKLDGGFAIFAKPGDSTLVYGGTAGDADALRKVMIDSVRQAQKEGQIPQDQFERIDYQGFSVVVIKGIKIDDLEEKPADSEELPGAEEDEFSAQEMFGPEVQAVMALKGGVHYLAIGTHALDRVKAVIDASLKGAAEPAVPLTLSVGMKAAMVFSKQADAGDFPPEVVEKIKGLDGPDRIMLRVAPAGRGATLRLELERQPLLACVILAMEGAKNGPPGGFGEVEPAPDDGF